MVRVNESFNHSNYLKSLALPENLKNNNTLWNKFFPAAAGTGIVDTNEDIGQNIYERIANFVNNHSDIDVCNVNQLISLAELTDVNTVNFNAEFPAEIKRLLDITSTPKSKLWGVKEQDLILEKSIGKQYNTETDYLTAGTQIISRNRFDSSLSLEYVSALSGNIDIYPVKQFPGYRLAPPVSANYFFYHFEPTYKEEYAENIIDWESEFTTLSQSNSSNEAWFGDNGAVETAFRYILTKNLFLK
jgi:hypothetical protein